MGMIEEESVLQIFGAFIYGQKDAAAAFSLLDLDQALQRALDAHGISPVEIESSVSQTVQSDDMTTIKVSITWIFKTYDAAEADAAFRFAKSLATDDQAAGSSEFWLRRSFTTWP